MRRSPIITIALALFLSMLAQAAPPPSLAANPNIGYEDATFGSAAGSDATSDKPQSKLWYNDGFWWANMFDDASKTWHINRLNWPNKWVDTGVVVDDRPLARSDCLWDGTHLYIASTLSNSSSSTQEAAANQGRLYRYSYSGGVYTLDAGFPAVMMTGSIESLTFDKDTTGKLWITFTQSKKVYVNRSTSGDSAWGTPFVVPGPTSATSLNSDDISALVAYHDQSGNSIGVLWSNHNDPSSMYFAYHQDGDADTTWSAIEQIYTAECAADDHINLKSLQSDSSGTIYAAVKTSFGDSGCGGNKNSTLLQLVVRKPNNSWIVAPYATVGDDMTRPLVLLDTSNRQVYMFATSPTACGIIYMKSTSMDNPSFVSGKGTAFISSSIHTCLNNATSTKQTVNASTGLVVMASDETDFVYMHNVLVLGTDTTPPTVTSKTPIAGATGVDTAAAATATFSEPVVGVSNSTFTLTQAGGAAVAASVSYDAATRTATLQPSAALAPSTSYTAALTAGIKDGANNALAPLSWSFTTAAAPDTTPPTVTAQSPAANATGVNVASHMTATFSEPMNSASITTSSVTLLDANMAAVPATVTYNAANRTVTLSPSASLAAGSVYTAKLSAAITDAAGNALVPLSWSFTTAPGPDTTPPTITAISPASGATSVPTSTIVSATFSEPLDSASLGNASFSLSTGSTTIAATVVYNVGTRTATLTPLAALTPGSVYTAHISGVKDLAGNALATPATWSFSTAAAPAADRRSLFLPIITD